MYDVVLVPTDGSEASLRAADEAFRIARETGAVVHALYVIDESASSLIFADRPMADLLEALGEEGNAAVAAVADRATALDADADVDADVAAADVEVVTDVVRGMQIHEAIIEYAADHDVDLVVMGTHGRKGLQYLLGSTTERVIANSFVPVLVVSEREGDRGT